jgi:hypothetical protein
MFALSSPILRLMGGERESTTRERLSGKDLRNLQS